MKLENKYLKKDEGAILLISLILVVVLSVIGLSFSSLANMHKKTTLAQKKMLSAKINSFALSSIIVDKISDPVNPCTNIAGCVFLDQEEGSKLENLVRGVKSQSWWQKNSQQNAYLNQDNAMSRYIIREISSPRDGAHIYEVIGFAADKNGDYQYITRQYKTLVDPKANQPSLVENEDLLPDWPLDAAGTANEQYFTTLTEGIINSNEGVVTEIRGPSGTDLNVNGTINLNETLIYNKPAMVRNAGQGGYYNNNAGNDNSLAVRNDFIILVVGKVNKWPLSSMSDCCANCRSQATLVEFGYYSFLSAFVPNCGADKKFAFSAGHETEGSLVEVKATDVFIGEDTQPFIAVYRKRNNSEFSVFTADRHSNIVNHGTVYGVGNASGNYHLSIGPYQSAGENGSGDPQVSTGEFRYIDKVYTDQEVTDLISSTLNKWGFP